MHNFLFDATLKTSIRIDAEDEASARAMLEEALDCATANFGRLPDGSPIVGEVSLHAPGDDEPALALVEFDDEPADVVRAFAFDVPMVATAVVYARSEESARSQIAQLDNPDGHVTAILGDGRCHLAVSDVIIDSQAMELIEVDGVPIQPIVSEPADTDDEAAEVRARITD